MADTSIPCDACGAPLRDNDTFRTDGDGFTACLPSFPVSNRPDDGDRFMRGPCYRSRVADHGHETRTTASERWL